MSQTKTICIDIRALMHPGYSGVHTYIYSMLDALFAMDTKNHYILFSNSKKQPKQDFGYGQKFTNVTHIHTRYSNKWLSFAFSFGFLGIDQLLLKKNWTRPDLIWIPDPRPSHSQKAPLITSFHDLSFVHYKHTFNKKTRLFHMLIRPKHLAQKSDLIVAVSKHTKQDLIDTYHIPENKIHVIYEASQKIPSIPKETIYKIQQKYQLPKNFFLSIGTLEPRKNIDMLTKAFKEQFPDTYLVIAGESKESIFAKAKITLSPNIYALGKVEEQEKHVLYSLSLGLLFPSRYEGFGLPVLEAFAHKKSVFTSKNSSMEEIGGNAAFYTNPFCYDTLCTDLSTYIYHTDTRKQLENQTQKELSKFSWDKAARDLITLFA